MTNHHCARESVEAVSRPGEDLLGKGFAAQNAADERAVKDLFVDQLVAIKDVTEDVMRGLDAPTPEQAADALDARIRQTEARLDAEAKRTDALAVVQIVRLYSGAKLSAYTFRRYKDVRLVTAPELGLGFFGGDADNFTYPRYALDLTFFRVYERGEPVRTANYFRWNISGGARGRPGVRRSETPAPPTASNPAACSNGAATCRRRSSSRSSARPWTRSGPSTSAAPTRRCSTSTSASPTARSSTPGA